MQKTILVLNGPNLNLLGTREPEKYGIDTLEDIEKFLGDRVKNFDVRLEFIQANGEEGIIGAIHNSSGYYGIVLNAGAFSHYSYAIRDAISSVNIPVVEVHMTNIFAREFFRHVSVISPVCAGVVSGFGWRSYLFAIEAFCYM